MWQPDPRNPYDLIEWDGRCFMIEHRPDVHYVAHQDDGTPVAMSAPQAPTIWEHRDGQWLVVGDDMTARVIVDLYEAQREAAAPPVQTVGVSVSAASPDHPTRQGASTEIPLILPALPWRERVKPIFDQLEASGHLVTDGACWRSHLTRKEVARMVEGPPVPQEAFARANLVHKGLPVHWTKARSPTDSD
ncbi:MAG TPA: hypothetical protein VNQ78_16155 [Paracoccus sp. (in: a-proteobacteria)]|uniref:hypothetical protein n=1 Tax=Paracoccus sp. TaxID=267 RepID=UPI002CA19F79|nr:hypothetical protein [Paracoccus sp. (in: a-proteobacteria)]HWL58194.1 hypothetical protein [Paracoccus sp. (in: a-proteobacteria)]